MKYRTENERELSLMVRVWAKILPVESGCWEWQGSTDISGYARISYKNQPELVSRILLSKIVKKELTRLEYACHKCDNPRCCNPAHLFLGTPKDNTDDMMKKRRHICFINPNKMREVGLRMKKFLPRFEGESHPQAKLTEKEVLEIRTMYVPRKVTLKSIARIYKIDYTTVSDIIRRKIWTHI